MLKVERKATAAASGPMLTPYTSLIPFAIANLILLGAATVAIAIIVLLGAGSSTGGNTAAWGHVNWVLWLPAFVTIGVPILALLADRTLDLPAPRLLRRVGVPAAILLTAVILLTLVREDSLFTLIWGGVVAALLGTVLLDAVRLIGVHVFKAFPLDMPMMFGLIWLGLAQRMQSQMMARMVELTAALPPAERRRAFEPRVKAISRLSPASRDKVVRAMVFGLGRLDSDRRQGMLVAQMEILATLEPERRMAVMQSMDRATAPAQDGAYGQPWGMLRIPLPQFRTMAAVALPRTAQEAKTSLVKTAFWGYLWHFLNGISLVAPYTLLFGPGNWPVALGWGVFIWIGMMGFMPFMMRMLHFPWWFPVIPLIAHIAMMLPMALIAPALIQGGAIDASLLGRLVVGK